MSDYNVMYYINKKLNKIRVQYTQLLWKKLHCREFSIISETTKESLKILYKACKNF